MKTLKKRLQIVKASFLGLAAMLLSGLPAQDAAGVNYVIVANAPIQQPLEGNILLNATHIVALDGAAIPLIDQGATPTVIIGDMDSITFLGHRKIPPSVRVVQVEDQSKTDLEKGIEFCDQQGATSIMVLNALGGRVDHTLWNIQVLKKYYNPSRPLLLVSGTQSVSYHKNETVPLHGKRGDNCGVFGAPKATVTSRGLKYNMNKQPLMFGTSGSVSNALASARASMDIQGEAIVIRPLAE